MSTYSGVSHYDKPIPIRENVFVIRQQVNSAFGQTCREVKFEPTKASTGLNLLPRSFLQNARPLLEH